MVLVVVVVCGGPTGGAYVYVCIAVYVFLLFPLLFECVMNMLHVFNAMM